MAARIAIIAMTTRSSMRVNALFDTKVLLLRMAKLLNTKIEIVFLISL
jgi:hypothetical protein